MKEQVAQTDVMAGVVAVIRVLFVTVVNWRPWNWSTELSICPLIPIKQSTANLSCGGEALPCPDRDGSIGKEDDHADDEEPEGRNGCWRPIREQPFERNGLESPQKPDEGQEDICCLRADDHRPL